MEYLVKGLQGGQKYAVQVRSIAGSEVSEWSPVLQVTAQTDSSIPRRITDLTGRVYGASFLLSWTKPIRNTNGSKFRDFQDYELKIVSGTGTAFRYYTSTSITYSLADNIEDFGTAQPNLTFTVAARDKVGNQGLDSNIVALSNPAPAAPLKLTSKSTPTGIRVQWKPTTDIDFSLYEVYVGDTLTFTPDTTSFGNLKYSGRNNSVDIAVTTGLKYIKVCVVDNFDQRSAFSVTSNSAGNATTGDDSAFANTLSDIVAVNYWKLDELDGTIANDYASGNDDGSYQGGVGHGSEQLFVGNSQYSSLFDGSDDYVEINTPDLKNLTSAWTVGLTVRPSAIGSNTTLITHASLAAGVPFNLGITATGHAASQFYSGSSWDSAFSATTLVSGSEYFLVGTWDGTDVKIYVDGVEDGSWTATGVPGAADVSKIFIGHNENPSSSGTMFAGLAQDAFIANRAFSPEEILALWNALGSGISGGTSIAVKDEGITVSSSATSLNFVGSGVSATASGSEVTVTIGGTGGGTGRQTMNITTASLTDGSTQNGSAPMAAAYRIYSITVDRACRIRLYPNGTYRTADAGRAIGTDPTGDHGVMLDAAFTGAGTLTMSPMVDGFVYSGTDVIYAIENRSGSTASVSVDFLYVGTE